MNPKTRAEKTNRPRNPQPAALDTSAHPDHTHTKKAPVAMKTKTTTAPASPISYPDPFAAATPEERLVARRDAWVRTQEARRAVTKQQLCKLNFDVDGAATIMQAAHGRVVGMREQIASLPGVEARCVDMLLQYCAAMIYADDLVYEQRKSRSSVAMNADAEKSWERLMLRLTVLAQDGYFPMEVLDEVRVGSGWRDRGKDLGRLATHAIERWDAIAPHTTLKREDLSRALELSDQLRAHFGAVGAPRVTSELALERHQAISLAYGAYEEVRRAVSFLRWYEQDALKIAPSVHNNPLQKRGKRDEQLEGEPEGPAENGGEGTNAKGPSANEARRADAQKPADPKAPGAKPAPAPAYEDDDDDGPIELGPNGLPLVPQDDPFAKD